VILLSRLSPKMAWPRTALPKMALLRTARPATVS